MDEQDDLELKVLLEKRLEYEREEARKILKDTGKFNNQKMIEKNSLISKIKELLDLL
jgi:hypothetical protein